jgi:23S rRNA pseudouridine1911/1915/1917 synthase
MNKPTLYTFIVEQKDEGSRLDQYCFTLFPDYSRTFIQHLIDEQLITVNNKQKKASYKIKEHDQLACNIAPPKEISVAPKEIDFEVIFEDPDFLIINKPAGLSVHPSSSNPEEITLVHGLLHRYPEFAELESQERPGIVHRLDKDTSGLLIVARTIPACITFSQLFKDRKIEKKYLAVVEGLTEKSGSIDFPIARDKRDRHKMTHTDPEGRNALTHFTVETYFTKETLLKVHIITGRTHQIRVHCAAIGHSLVGDATYGKKSPLIARQALHAAETGFTYKNKAYHFIAPLPTDFQTLLDQLTPYPLDQEK